MPDQTLPEGTDHVIAGAGVDPDDGPEDGASPDLRVGEETMFTPDERPGDDPSPAPGGTGAAGAAGKDDARRPGQGGTTTNLFDTLTGWQSAGTDRAREFAQAGLDRATGAIDDVVKMINDAADQIDDRVGEQYGVYARRAAESVGGFGDLLKNKDVDDLFADARELVKRSPAVAVGAAAALGFVVARLARAGIDAAEAAGTAAAGAGGAKGGAKGGGAA